MSSSPVRERALWLWISGFEITIDVFRLVRRLPAAEARALGPRLLECASRLPASIARGESSRAAFDAARCRQQTLFDLSEMEWLLRCVPLRGREAPEVGALLGRLRELKQRSAAEAASPAPGPRKKERGAALMIALVISATLAALGLAALQLGDVSLRVAARARDREALREVAETGARMVKRWFDAPASGPLGDPAARHLFLGRFDLRGSSAFDRSRRLLDGDGNPATPPVAADGSAGREFYRQGRLDLFLKPWRPGTILTLLGPPEGPDLVLEDREGTVDLMDRLNAALLDDQTRGRLARLEIHAPPIDAAGRRLGFATVTVTAAHYPRLTMQEGLPVVPTGLAPDGVAVVRMGLSEIPMNTPRGPLAACGDIHLGGAVRAHWGPIVAGGAVDLGDTATALDASVPSGFPWADLRRRIGGAALAAWESQPLPRIEDPWLRVLAGGSLGGWEALPDQPFPYDPNVPGDRDHSNLFQRVAGAACPSFDYATWKRLVTSSLASDRQVHHFTYDAFTGLFREGGAGAARSVRDWTHGREGIFFFDTRDGLPPTAGNLTPAVSIAGAAWHMAGLLYLNAASFSLDSAAGASRVLIPPGEPCDDANGNLACDAGEVFVNLVYATTVGTGTPTDDMTRQPLAGGTARAVSCTGETYTGVTTAARDAQGLPIAAAVNLFGILYNAGNIVAEGEGVHFGSLVAGGSIVQSTTGAASPVVYFDDRIARGIWPPPEIAMPRTAVTFWQTQHP